MPIPPMGLDQIPKDGRLETAVLEALIQHVGDSVDEQLAQVRAEARARAVAMAIALGG